MSSRLKIALFALLAVSLALGATAQDRRPLSPRGAASTQVAGKWVARDDGEMTYQGGKWIDVDYGRPIKRGRDDLWGSGEDYGKKVDAGAPVWRLGANQTTRLTTEAPLEIAGKKLEPGTYSLFVDLKPGAWTLIVSNQPAQESYDREDKTATWGSYNYDPKYDLVRAPMKMKTRDHSVDQLTIAFLDMTDSGGKLAVAWDQTAAAVDFKVAE